MVMFSNVLEVPGEKVGTITVVNSRKVKYRDEVNCSIDSQKILPQAGQQNNS